MQKITIDNKAQEKWNCKHAQLEGVAQPAKIVTENLHLLPAKGSLLDLACGQGVNALYLAEKTKLSINAWDISNIAIDRVRSEANVRGLTINAQVKDVLSQPPKPNQFDVIVVTHFLDRNLMPTLMDALRLGGVLFYQTYTQTAVSHGGPSNPKMRLKDNELLELFRPLRVRAYQEEAMLGDVKQGWRNLALLVAEKI